MNNVSKGNKALGKGLSALMADDYTQEFGELTRHGATIIQLPLGDVVSGKYQPRHYFDEQSLHDLSESIKQNGIMQPILVRPLQEKRQGATYEIIAGERRWRAARLAGLLEVPVIIKDIDDNKALELALIENIQRQDLSVLEESEGYQQLMDSFGYTQEQLSNMIGKSRSHIANCLRLLTLPESVKVHMTNGEISAGHARALLQSKNPEEMVQEVVRRGLNVRQTENMARSGMVTSLLDISVKNKSSASAKKKLPSNNIVNNVAKDPDIIVMEENISENLGLKIEINDNDNNGNVIIHYNSLNELDKILNMLSGEI
jgi:ParB family transcriptional regulator, chromosome partitioning protein